MLWVFFSSTLVSLSDADRERDTEGKSAQPLETWRFTPLTYLAWIGLLPCCCRSNTAISLISETDDGHVVADQGDDNVEDGDAWNCDNSDVQDRPGEKGSHAKKKFLLSRKWYCYTCGKTFRIIILVFVCTTHLVLWQKSIKNSVSCIAVLGFSLDYNTSSVCFVRDVFLFANSWQTLIELSQIIQIIWAKSVVEEDFPSNYRKMAVLIKVLITEGDSIFGYLRLCLFTTKSQMVSPSRNQTYKLEQFFSHVERSCLISWISQTEF